MGFVSWRDFDDFIRIVKFERRYIHSKTVLNFLDALKDTLPTHCRSLSKEVVLYRSQVGCDEHVDEGEFIMSGYTEDRMKPNSIFCGDGRANPRGIPYFYLSSDADTSMAEIRPNIGQVLSVAQFRIGRELKIVDCYSAKNSYGNVEFIFNPPVNQEDMGRAIWSQINYAFSRPVKQSESSADYIPTQVLSEWFLDQGFDGICFRSGLGKGYNFVLFDTDSANLISCGVYEVKSLQYEFSECATRYFKS